MEETRHKEPLPVGGAAEQTKGETDFDRSEPRALLIVGLGFATVVGLVAIILGIQAYFDHIREEAVYEKVSVPVADDLKNIHSQEDGELNSFKYLDRDHGILQIPINRAMQLIAEEASSNKLKYFQKPTPVKSADAPAPGTGADGAAAPGDATAQPGASASGTEKSSATGGTDKK